MNSLNQDLVIPQPIFTQYKFKEEHDFYLKVYSNFIIENTFFYEFVILLFTPILIRSTASSKFVTEILFNPSTNIPIFVSSLIYKKSKFIFILLLSPNKSKIYSL